MTRRPSVLVGLLSLTATASYLCRVNVSVAGPQLMEEFGLTQVQMGWVFSAFLLGYALFQIPGGMLADRFGARRILAASAVWWIVTTTMLTMVGFSWFRISTLSALLTMLILRFIIGIGEAPTFPAAAQGVSCWIPAIHQGRANGFVVAAIGLGSAIAPLLITGVMVNWGWRAAILVSSLPALLVAIAWFYIKENELPMLPTKELKSPIKNYASLRSRSFILLSISYTLQGYVGYIFVFWFYLYLVQVRHFDLLRSAVFSSLPWILSIISIPLGGIVSDRLVSGPLGPRWGRRAVPLLGLTLSGILLALGAHATNAYLAVAYLAFSTACVLCVEGPFWATMMEIAENKSGAAGGVMNMGSNIGGLISPALTPLLASTMGWVNALYIAAGISLIGALLWLGISPCRDSLIQQRTHN